jgi:glycosyltransferase, group 4 family
MPNMNSWIAYGKAAFALHNLFEHKGIENYTSSFSTDKQMPYTWVSNVVFRKLLLNIEHQKENDHIIIRYPAKSDKMAYKHWLELLKDRDPSTEPASLVPLHK